MRYLLLLCVLFLLNNCAASLAVTSNKIPDLSDVAIGATQSEVESIMGLRDKTLILSPRERIDYYRYLGGGDPDLVRGGVHAAMTVGTGGLWEIIGVPFERNINKEQYLAVTYKNNIVADVRYIAILPGYN